MRPRFGLPTPGKIPLKIKPNRSDMFLALAKLMNRLLPTAFIILFGHLVFAGSAGAADMSVPQDSATPPPCPSTLAEAEALRLNMLSVTSERRGANSIALYLQRLKWFSRQIDTCLDTRLARSGFIIGERGEAVVRRIPSFFGSANEFRQTQACFARARDFYRLTANSTAPPETNRSATEIPSDLLDPELSIATLSEATVERALAIIERLNSRRGPNDQLIAAPFTSRIPAPDDGMALYRFIVYVPGEPQRYVMFAGRSGTRELERGTKNISVVGIARDASGNARSYYADYDRNWQATDPFSGRIVNRDNIQNWQQVTRLNSPRVQMHMRDRGKNMECQSCHTQGPIPIVFENMQSSPFIEQIRRINATMQNDAPPALRRGLNLPYPLTPAIGPVRERTDAWLDTCIQQVPELATQFADPNTRETMEYRRLRGSVAQAMNCASCHNGRSSHHLTYTQQMFYSLDSGRLSLNIRHNDMPREHKLPLNRLEREAVTACLTEEYLFSSGGGQPGLLMQWALGESCLPNPNPSNPRERASLSTATPSAEEASGGSAGRPAP